MSQIILKINSTADIVYDDDNICCYLLNAGLPETFLRDFKAPGDKMRLLQGADAADKCKTMAFDGVVAEPDVKQPLKAPLKKIREIIGTKKVLGVVIPPRRHEAMLAAEVEPEFVAFRLFPENRAAAAEIISWYNEFFLIQNAADLTSETSGVLPAEVDFVIINSQNYKDFGC